MSPEDISVVENPAQSRFEAQLDGYLAVADYRLEGDSMIFTHTEVPPAFRGRGIAEKLVLAGFRAARERKLKIVPLCSYVAVMLQRHPEFADQ